MEHSRRDIASCRDVSQIRARSLYHRPWFHSPPAPIENRRRILDISHATTSTISKAEYQSFHQCRVFAKRCKRIVVEGTVDVGVFGDANEGPCIRSVDLLVGFKKLRYHSSRTVARETRCHHNSNEGSGEPTVSHNFRFREHHAGCGVVPDSFVDSSRYFEYAILLSIYRPQLFYPF